MRTLRRHISFVRCCADIVRTLCRHIADIVPTLCGHCADIVRTYISRDMCSYNVRTISLFGFQLCLYSSDFQFFNFRGQYMEVIYAKYNVRFGTWFGIEHRGKSCKNKTGLSTGIMSAIGDCSFMFLPYLKVLKLILAGFMEKLQFWNCSIIFPHQGILSKKISHQNVEVVQ